MNETITMNIAYHVKDEGSTAKELVDALNANQVPVDKKIMNQSLYRMKDLGLVTSDDAKPPKFKLAPDFGTIINEFHN